MKANKMESKAEALSATFEVGQYFENGNHVKFQVTEMEGPFMILTELTTAGALTKKRKKYKKDVFAKLMINKYFDKTPFARRETYGDLRGLEIGKFFNK